MLRWVDAQQAERELRAHARGEGAPRVTGQDVAPTPEELRGVGGDP
jgi:hypothetical protein